jgi:hypothetical protein
MKFNSTVKTIGEFKSDWSQDDIKNEPMLFNCSLEFADKHGGPITRQFLYQLYDRAWCEHSSNGWVIDSRVHMLMPGWYPCIPGMHHDDVPRSTATGQPNYVNPEYHAVHVMGLVNGDICPTQFALGEIELDLPSDGEIIYKTWHPQVMDAIDNGTLKSYDAPSGVILEFDAHAFHQGTRAVKGGWRWFIRVSRETDRAPTNEIRRQVQVYLENPMEGW